MAYLLAGIILVMLFGAALVFWPNRFRPEATQVAFGTSLATGAAISLAFFVLQADNEANQDRLSRKQTLALSIALQRDLTHADLHGADLRKLDLARKDLT